MDRYDMHIEKLKTMGKDEVTEEWCLGRGIFNFRGEGCLIMIHSGNSEGHSPELDEEIQQDSRLPSTVKDLTPEHYPIFAEWHRKLDSLGFKAGYYS